MSYVDSLAPILMAPSSRKLDRWTQSDLLLDVKSGQVVTERLWFGRRKLRVTNARDPKAYIEEDRLIVEMGNFGSDAPPIRVQLSYQARCAPGDEIRLVETLGLVDNGRQALNQQVSFWLKELVQRHADALLNDCPAQLKQIKKKLIALAYQNLGLTLSARLCLADTEQLSSLHIGPKELSVRVGPQRWRLNIQVEVRLDIDNARLIAATRMLPRQNQLDVHLDLEIARFFEEEVSLHDFHTVLQTEVACGLKHRLSRWAQTWGRCIERVYLDSTSSVDVQDELETGHSFRRKLPEYPEPVNVECSLLLRLEDLGRYVAANLPPLESWAHETIERVTRKVLFSTRYSELVSTYDDKKKQIEKHMRTAAAKIGYALDQFLTITDLQMEVLRRPFSLQVHGEFATRTPNVRAGLEAILTARINDQNGIKSLLDRKEEVVKALEDEIKRALELAMHGVEPEEFYLYFRSPRPLEDGSASDEPTLADRLAVCLVERLKNPYKAIVSSVVFKQTDTEIYQLLRKLRGTQHEVAVKVKPKGGNHLPMTFEAILLVQAVDPRGWQNFLELRPTSEDLVSTVRQALEYKLSEVDPVELYQFAWERLKAHINQWAKRRIGEQFGLWVEVSDLRRCYTEEETLRVDNKRRLVQANAHDQKQQIILIEQSRERKRELVDKRQAGHIAQFEANIERLAAENDEEEIRELEEALDRIEGKVHQSEQSIAFKQLAEEISRSTSLGGYSAQDGKRHPPQLISLGEPPESVE